MRKFDYSDLKNKKWDIEVLGYIASIYEVKGKQELYLKQKPNELNELIEIAKIQSTESSNAIEGIRTTNSRLKQLVGEKTTPRNRDEEEIAGYRDALKIIHESFESIPITPNYILQLHKILFSHSNRSIGGKFKNAQNYITSTDENGNSYTLFTPLTPHETPDAMQQLCDAFNREIGKGIVEPLLLIPIFIHDFLCIHPFTDGNGRMSRLLTTLLLYRSGFYVGRYISLESKISKSKDFYYNALEKSQQNWLEGLDNADPFVKYILGTIISAYRDFDDRMEIVSEKLPALEMVKKAVQSRIAKFTKQDIKELCPSLSISAIEKALRELIELKEIERKGINRATYYIRLK